MHTAGLQLLKSESHHAEYAHQFRISYQPARFSLQQVAYAPLESFWQLTKVGSVTSQALIVHFTLGTTLIIIQFDNTFASTWLTP